MLPGLNLTNEQLFFIGFAQTWCTKTTTEIAKIALIADMHAPSNCRVIGSLTNMSEFSTAFKCPVGSSMNYGKQCEIWETSNDKFIK